VTLLRTLLGDALRRRRHEQDRTLRDVSSTARVSLAYLSEVERGRKEPSSELLAAICRSLDVPLSEVIQEVGDQLAARERAVGLPEKAAVAPVPVAPVPLSSRRSHREPVARAAA
jgi:transcriptional regulator with XRE-family HTH domain